MNFDGPSTVAGQVQVTDGEVGARFQGTDGEVGARFQGRVNIPVSVRDIENIVIKSGDQILAPEPTDFTSPKISLAGGVDVPSEGVSNGNVAGFTFSFANATFTQTSNGGAITHWEDVDVSGFFEGDDGERLEFESRALGFVESDRISFTAREGDLPVLEGLQVDRASMTVRFSGDVIDNQDPTVLPVNDVQFSFRATRLDFFSDTTGSALLGAGMREATTALRFPLNPGAIEGLFQPDGRFDLALTETTFGAKTVLGMPMNTLSGLLRNDPGVVHWGSATVTAVFPPSGSGSSPSANGPSGNLEPIVKTFFISFLLNSSVIAHVPFGELGTLAITSQLILNNPYGETVEGAIRFFSTADGSPIEATIDELTASAHSFSIGPLESRLFEIDPTGVVPLQLAWASVNATRNLSVAANFAIVDTAGSAAASSVQGRVSGQILAEAGIAATAPGFRHILNVLREGPVDTGFAILNPTGGPADITLRLTENPRVGDREFETTLFLPPRRQRAFFPDDLFGLGAGSFEGTLEIQADTSMAVISLKTLNGFQSSSLPSGTP